MIVQRLTTAPAHIGRSPRGAQGSRVDSRPMGSRPPALRAARPCFRLGLPSHRSPEAFLASGPRLDGEDDVSKAHQQGTTLSSHSRKLSLVPSMQFSSTTLPYSCPEALGPSLLI